MLPHGTATREGRCSERRWNPCSSSDGRVTMGLATTGEYDGRVHLLSVICEAKTVYIYNSRALGFRVRYRARVNTPRSRTLHW